MSHNNPSPRFWLEDMDHRLYTVLALPGCDSTELEDIINRHRQARRLGPVPSPAPNTARQAANQS